MKARVPWWQGVSASAAIVVATVVSGCTGESAATACPDCTIELTPVATLGRPTDSVLIDFTATARRLSTGDFVAGSVFESTVLLYDSTGSYKRSYRRKGQGPGEVADVSAIAVGPGDSVYVADGSNHRIVVLGPTLEFEREFRSPIDAADLAVLPDGRVVVEGRHPDAPDRLHIYSPAGDLLRSFAPSDGASFEDIAVGGAMAPTATADAVWLSARNRLRAESWTLDGVRTTVLQSTAPWFQPWDTVPAQWIAEMRPFSLVSVIQHSHAHDVLWVAAMAPDSLWSASRPRTGGEEQPVELASSVIDDALRSRDTFLAAVDPRTGAVLAAHRSRDVLSAFVGPDLIARPRRTPEGAWSLDILRIALRRPAPPG